MQPNLGQNSILIVTGALYVQWQTIKINAFFFWVFSVRAYNFDKKSEGKDEEFPQFRIPHAHTCRIFFLLDCYFSFLFLHNIKKEGWRREACD